VQDEGFFRPDPRRLKGLSGNDWRVLTLLCELAHPAGIVNKTQREIGFVLDMGESVVRRSLRDLEAAGAITRETTRGGNVYSLAVGRSGPPRGAGEVHQGAPRLRIVTRPEAAAAMLGTAENAERPGEAGLYPPTTVPGPIIHVM
jgi:hypothetical protein